MWAIINWQKVVIFYHKSITVSSKTSRNFYLQSCSKLVDRVGLSPAELSWRARKSSTRKTLCGPSTDPLTRLSNKEWPWPWPWPWPPLQWWQFAAMGPKSGFRDRECCEKIFWRVCTASPRFHPRVAVLDLGKCWFWILLQKYSNVVIYIMLSMEFSIMCKQFVWALSCLKGL